MSDPLDPGPTAVPGPIKLDPEATYAQPALAAALGVSLRHVQRMRDDRRARFPRPFFIGRNPCWRGDVINARGWPIDSGLPTNRSG